MKYIFLDIDGVLNVISQGQDEFGSLFHPHLVENLRTVMDATGAKIIISSTWRCAGLWKMQLMWEMRDLPGEVIDVTPELNLIRGEEIAEYLRKNPADAYVILDDDDDMLPEQMPYFVRTSENLDHEDCCDRGFGLTKKCAEQAIKILNL